LRLRNRGQLESDPQENREDSEPADGAQALDENSSDLSSSRLLMAPPRSGGGELIHRMSILGHRVSSGLGITTDTLNYTFRLALFLLKVFTLTQPCWPYVVSFEVATPLVLIAAIELGWPISTSSDNWGRGDARYRVSIITNILLLGVHLATLWIARRWNILCTSSHEEWAEWREDSNYAGL
jgi:hypothetical protein